MIIARQTDSPLNCRDWFITLLAGAGVYLAFIGVALWDFWPHLGACVMDTRHLACANYDKIYELERTYPGDFHRAWSIAADLLGGRGVGTEPMAFNLLPTALVGLLGLVLPMFTAYNLVTLGAWLTNGLAACALVFFVTRHRAAAVLGGFLFAFSPMVFATQHCRSLDYELAFPLPLLLLAMWGVRARPGKSWPTALGALLVVLGLINQYYLVGMAALLVAWAALCYLRPVSETDAPSPAAAVLRLALACLGALLVLSPWLLVEVLKLQAEHPEATRLLIADTPDPPAMFWRFDLEHTGTAWLVLTMPLVAAGVALSSRVRRADRLFLAGAVLLFVVLLYFVLPPLHGAMRELPVLWRMREVDKISALPALLCAWLGGVGWATVASRLPNRAARLAAHGVALALCLWCTLQGVSWWQTISSNSPTMTIPDELARRLERLSPRPLVAALATHDVNEHLPYSFQIALRHRTGAEMVEPGEAATLQARLQKLLGVPIRGDVKEAGDAPPPRRKKRSPARCQVLGVFFARHKDPPTGSLQWMGFTRVLHTGQGLVVAGTVACR